MKTWGKNKNKSIKIQIAEDNRAQALLLKNILEKEGYSVAVSRNGKEALFSIKRSRPRIVISDVVMPEMDGYTLCRHIKEDQDLRDISVILI